MEVKAPALKVGRGLRFESCSIFLPFEVSMMILENTVAGIVDPGFKNP